jgi:HPt (histidine-containing phosphotransfer) domain-containing protein
VRELLGSEVNEMSDAQEKTAALLAALWQKNRPIIDERLAALDATAAAAAAGSVNDTQRNEGQGAAHKLAGALGMYGFDEGTRIARELEVLLESGAAEPGQLSALIAELRAAVFPEG